MAIDLTEATAAAAQAIHAEGWTCEAHEPLGLDQCDQCATATPRVALATLTAALPHVERQIREQIYATAIAAISAAYGGDDWMHTSDCQVTPDCPLCIALAAITGYTRQETDHE